MFFIFFLLNGVFQSGVVFVKSLFQISPHYEIGAEVQLEGTINKSYTNGLIGFDDKSGNSWMLKSNYIDINKYKGEGVVQGIISDTTIDKKFVIDVQKIYKALPDDRPNIITKYMDISAGLQIDVSSDPNYFVDIDQSNTIYIKDLRTFRAIVKIEPFYCDRKIEDRNCGKIVWEGDNQSTYDSFIGSDAMKYYKLSQGFWFVDDKQGKGYHIYAGDDSSMYKISEYIGLLGKDWISGKIYDKLDTLCRNEEFIMNQAESVNIKQSNGNWFAIVVGKSTKKEPIQCEIYLNNESKQGVNFELTNILPL